MRAKILETLPNDRHSFEEVDYVEIHVVDWKNIDNNRGIEIFNATQDNIKSVCLFNENKIKVAFDKFGENALPISKGVQAEQCECIAFPSGSNEQIWILAIETKYANNEFAAFRIKADQNYPQKMVSQIVSTVEYLRAKSILDKEQLVHAIISFPILVSDFNSTLFSYVKEEWSIENLLVTKKIRIKVCNSAKITSEERIKLL